MNIEIVNRFERIDDRAKKRYGALWLVSAVLDPVPKGAEGVLHYAEIALRSFLTNPPLKGSVVGTYGGWSQLPGVVGARAQITLTVQQLVERPSLIPGDIAAWMQGVPEFVGLPDLLRKVLKDAVCYATDVKAAEERVESARNLAGQIANRAIERASEFVHYEERLRALREELKIATRHELTCLRAEIGRDGVTIGTSTEKMDPRVVHAALKHADGCVPSRLNGEFPFAASVAPVTVEDVT